MKKQVTALFLSIVLIVTLSSHIFAISNDPICAPADKGQLGQLIDESTEITNQDGLTIVDTVKTYLYAAQPLSETLYFKEKSRSIYNGSLHYATITLDADFYADSEADSVRCPRYYSSYDIYIDHMVGPDETDMEFKTGGSKPAWAKVICDYEYQYFPHETIYTESLTVGCDAGGGTL